MGGQDGGDVAVAQETEFFVRLDDLTGRSAEGGVITRVFQIMRDQQAQSLLTLYLYSYLYSYLLTSMKLIRALQEQRPRTLYLHTHLIVFILTYKYSKSCAPNRRRAR